MTSLADVAPFQAPYFRDSGVGNNPFQSFKGDMSTALPFPSQASASHPAATHARTSSLGALPAPPKAPPVPASLSRQTWDHYLRSFYTYIFQWNHFYSTLARASAALASDQAAFTPDGAGASATSSSLTAQPGTGIMPFWLSTFGETPEKRGWQAYMGVMRDEERLRKTLNVASELHRKAVDAHDRLRERVMRESVNW